VVDSLIFVEQKEMRRVRERGAEVELSRQLADGRRPCHRRTPNLRP
jgi:hypothetical protein